MSSDLNQNRNQDKAYVLHYRAYQNTSLIVELFTREHGRLSAVAKGARRANSPFQGTIQQFVPLFVSWGGRSEMKTLYTAENVSGSVKLAGDLIYTGFYLNELIMYLLHKHEAHASLFDRYHQCLGELLESSDIELSLRYFELDLLEQLGYGVSLDQDLRTGQPVNPELCYTYNIETGITSQTGDEAGVMQIKGTTLLALSQRNISTQEQRIEAKRLLRSVLDYHLEGRPLNARKLFLKKKNFSLSH
ncbi:MAG: DNA repair protein RecO [Thioalkalispiraceae bacterium]|jgi:DNA repair protein RecO (recombination protein O)